MAAQVRKTIRLHKAQHAFRHSPALFRGFVGGRGSGKSWAGAYDLLRRAQPRRTYLIASPTSVLMNDTTFPAVEGIARDLGLWPEGLGQAIKLSPYPTVRLPNGAVLRFRTAEDPEKLRGPNLSGVWLDEASLMAQGAYDIAIGCLREAGEQGWLSATFTPKGLTHWTYDVFGRGRPNTEIVHSRTRENPFNPVGFEATLAEQYDGLFAAQELGGEFVNVEGAEFPAEYFGDHIWFGDWPAQLKLRVLSLDPSKGQSDKWGDYSAFVLLGLTEDGTMWVDADMDNQRPTPRIVSDGLHLFTTWKPAAFVIETNMFQELLGGELMAAGRAHTPPLVLPLWGICNTVKKDVRIRTLGPFLAQRRLRFKANSKGAQRLVQQLRSFPTGDHDDGPDALEMALRMLLELMGQPQEHGPVVLRA